jgi:hypothetical protein
MQISISFASYQLAYDKNSNLVPRSQFPIHDLFEFLVTCNRKKIANADIAEYSGESVKRFSEGADSEPDDCAIRSLAIAARPVTGR